MKGAVWFLRIVLNKPLRTLKEKKRETWRKMSLSEEQGKIGFYGSIFCNFVPA